MSCRWFLRFFVICLISLSFIFGWLALTVVLGVTVLRLSNMLSLVFGFIFPCFSIVSLLIDVVGVSLFTSGVPVVWWLLYRMMFSWSTFSFPLLCVFVVYPGRFSGVPSPHRRMNRSTDGLLSCHSPLRCVMLVLLSSVSYVCTVCTFMLMWGSISRRVWRWYTPFLAD